MGRVYMFFELLLSFLAIATSSAVTVPPVAQLNVEQSEVSSLTFPSERHYVKSVLVVPYGASLQTHYLDVKLGIEFLPIEQSNRQLDDPKSIWEYEIRSSVFQSDPHAKIEFNRTLSFLPLEDLQVNLMTRTNLYWYFFLKCSPMEACDALHGSLRIVHRFTLKVDPCSVLINQSSETSICEQCASIRAQPCGFCAANTPLHGCWQGHHSGPLYSNHGVCGMLTNDGSILPQHLWLFGYEPSQCPAGTSVSLTSVFTIFVISLMCVCGCIALVWRMYEQHPELLKAEDDDAEHDQFETLFRPTARSHEDSTRLKDD